MKMGNKGFGMREMIIYICLIILLLLYISSSVKAFYSNMPKPSSNSTVSNQNNNTKDDNLKINYDYYKGLENNLKKATVNYLNSTTYNLSQNSIVVNANNLIDLGFLNNLYDQYGNSCNGYSKVYEINGIIKVETYVSCSNYTTNGY